MLTIWTLLRAIAKSWDDPLFRAALGLSGILLLSGTVFYVVIENWNWLDSFYFCVTTASTVGFGDLSPKTNAGKLFTSVYILVSVGVFVSVFSLLAKSLIAEMPVKKSGS